jgi:HD-GYP domain-containing protein (c-di-GMP phosphodiesterase class II)
VTQAPSHTPSHTPPNTPLYTLPVIYLYKPKGIFVGDVVRRLTQFKFQDPTHPPFEHPEPCCYVLTPSQYLEHKDKIKPHFLLFFIDDDSQTPTLRMQKKLPLTKALGYVKFPYTLELATATLVNALETYTYQAPFYTLCDLILKSKNDSEVLQHTLQGCIQLTHADAGFLFLDANLERASHGYKNLSKVLRQPSELWFKKLALCQGATGSTGPTVDIHKDFIKKTFLKDFNLSNHLSLFKDPKLDTLFTYDKAQYKAVSAHIALIKTPQEEDLGVLILCNRKPSPHTALNTPATADSLVLPFSNTDALAIQTLCHQTALALETRRFEREQKAIFSAVVDASISAIESRDPSTRWHSERVAILTVGLAEAINKQKSGLYSNIRFTPEQISEIQYASLLHDFGKIGIREHILLKEKKLTKPEMENIQHRFSILTHQVHTNLLEAYINRLMPKKEHPTYESVKKLQNQISEITDEMGFFWQLIESANEPNIISVDTVQKISDIASMQIVLNRESVNLLRADEIEKLSIKKGSLTAAERLDIERHVTYSFEFVSHIPWPQELKNLPEILYGHHERLDGTGYPRKLKANDIPIQSKMMAISDIYDALVAFDRPYKAPVPHEKALDILKSEATAGKLDTELLKIFIEANIGNLIADKLQNKKSAA